MPYHVWQIPEEELLLPTEQRKAEGWYTSRRQLTLDLKQSTELVQQLVNIRERFGKVRRREGQVGPKKLHGLTLECFRCDISHQTHTGVDFTSQG